MFDSAGYAIWSLIFASIWLEMRLPKQHKTPRRLREIETSPEDAALDQADQDSTALPKHFQGFQGEDFRKHRCFNPVSSCELFVGDVNGKNQGWSLSRCL